MPEALDELGVSSCEEFLNTYFNVDENDSKRLIQSMAYDSGLCVPQDLEKARNLYEELYQENADLLEIFVARLALIYSYGPQNLRNENKAIFYFKQAVIYSAIRSSFFF